MKLAVVITAYATAGLAAAGCQRAVDSRSFEQEIAARVATLGLTATHVECPSDVRLVKGTTFRCTVDFGGHRYELDATVGEPLASGTADVDIETHWARGDAIVGPKLETAMSAELSKTLVADTHISCGEPLRFLEADHTLTCDLAVGDQTAKLVTTFDDKAAPTTWRIDPPMLSRPKLEKILTTLVQTKAPAAEVTCGTRALVPRPPSGVVTCDVASGAEKGKLAATIDDKQNVTRWEIVKP